ncbi:MAG TPA: UvrD-helicase domain-containing protein [Phycisphaerae bacterium]|nr:UvrD-helicase domain-containing protein [Phycisphaerae bacterium]
MATDRVILAGLSHRTTDQLMNAWNSSTSSPAGSPERALDGLTAPQREAASWVDGPLLVLAGAGSGKTRTITRRIAYMVACGIPAWNILAITFTNKAAGEMRERVNHLLKDMGTGMRTERAWGPQGKGVTVATFHALCARLLREFAEAAGLSKTFTIFDTSDQSKAVKQAIKDVNLSPENFQPNAVLNAISNAKNKLQTAAAYTKQAGAFFEKNVARAYTRYEQILTENKAVDFDDLLLKMAILLRDNGDVRTQLQERYQYILIDEYQDTNHAQFMLAHMLAMGHKNICATGDPDQSIYGWRGANLNNILEFEQFYPNAKVVLLEQNYRSTKVILQAASALIARNTKRKKKDLWTENESGPRIEILTCNDEHQEAAEVVRRLKEQHDKNGLPWEKMAVFYRVNSLSRVLEDALMKQAVPYQIARGTEFYARKEVKDVLAYLRVIANPGDSVSLERIINVPTRGLGDTSLLKIQAYASQQRLTLLEACARAEEVPDLTTRAINSARKVAGLFDAWQRFVTGQVEMPKPAEEPEAAADPLFDAALLEAAQEEIGEAGTASRPGFLIPGGIRGLMEKVVRESGLEEEVKKADSSEGAADTGNARSSNVAELISVAAEFDVQNPEGTLQDYLQQVTLVSDVDKIKDAGGAVTLMTLHAAKGLEFPLVAMVGMEDGLIPHARAVGFAANPDEMEEERRLAFVGITRAMKQLMLSHARYRMIRGQTERTVESQFLSEMPAECFEEIDLTGEDEGVGSVGYRDEASYARRAQQQRGGGSGFGGYGGGGGGGKREAEGASQRRQADAIAGEFRKGVLVRHPQFGLGRIEAIEPSGATTKAVVHFTGSGKKTLILQYARLEKVDA